MVVPVEGIYKKYISIAKAENPNMFLADSYPPQKRSQNLFIIHLFSDSFIYNLKTNPITAVTKPIIATITSIVICASIIYINEYLIHKYDFKSLI